MDELAFKALFEATRGPLLAYLRQASGQEALAEDLLQETFLRWLHRPPRESHEGAQRAWLFTTASRLLRDHWRKDRRLGWLPWGDDEGDALEPACEAPGPDEVASQRQVLDRGFRALSPRQRALLWLAHVEGFDHHELGRALGLSPGSARVLLHRARTRMTATLEGLGIHGAHP